MPDMKRFTGALLRLGAAILVASLLKPAVASAELPVMPENWRAELAKVGTDPPPKELAANAHFVRSDESAHWVAHDSLKDLGGVLLGVGTDPNYFIAAWMKADLMLLVDFDQVVADVHTLYILALKNADTPDAFVQLWSPKQQAKFTELVQALPDAAAKKRALYALKLSRNLIYDRLLWLRRAYKEHKTPMCFSDPTQYAHVRELALKNRIWAWRGDLTGSITMMGLQAALKAIGQTVSVFYITNAEAYFDYTPQARKNLRDIPYGEKSMVLRTQGTPSKPDTTADGHYRYLVQKGTDFAGWLALKRVTSAKSMSYARKATATQGLYTLPGPPAAKK